MALTLVNLIVELAGRKLTMALTLVNHIV